MYNIVPIFDKIFPVVLFTYRNAVKPKNCVLPILQKIKIPRELMIEF